MPSFITRAVIAMASFAFLSQIAARPTPDNTWTSAQGYEITQPSVNFTPGGEEGDPVVRWAEANNIAQGLPAQGN